MFPTPHSASEERVNQVSGPTMYSVNVSLYRNQKGGVLGFWTVEHLKFLQRGFVPFPETFSSECFVMSFLTNQGVHLPEL